MNGLDTESKISTWVASYQFRKSMTGSYKEPRTSIPFPFPPIFLVLLLFVFLAADNGWVIFAGLCLLMILGIVYTIWSFPESLPFTKRHRDYLAWFESPEVREEAFAKIERQTAELKSLLRQMTEEEQSLLWWTASMSTSKSVDYNHVGQLLQICLSSPNISQSSFIQEVAAELAPKKGAS